MTTPTDDEPGGLRPIPKPEPRHESTDDMLTRQLRERRRRARKLASNKRKR